MSEFGTVVSVTQTVLAAPGCSILKEILPAISYKCDLKDLKKTVKTIESVLVDASSKRELSEAESDYLLKLKDAVYDAEDLFDRFFTLVGHSQSHQLKYGNTTSDKLSGKVRKFFSSRNPLKVGYLMSRDIRKIRMTLNAIADDHTKFRFSVETPPVTRMGETHSYVCVDDIVGREGDTTYIINRLLSSVREIGYLTIVGVGGVGKTSLAKLVLADERIKSEFPMRLWVSVSDQGGKPSDIKDVLSKILESIGCRFPHCTTLEYVQSTFQREMRGKKFLLVLDDVWIENMLQWLHIRNFLKIAGRGSRVIVTTRSRETARAMKSHTYELEGLSKENAWRLFERIAFRERFRDPKLVQIGEKILEKCCRVPLAIRVVASLLNRKSIHKWQALEMSEFSETCNEMNEIMSVLKFSYDHLEPSLKNCFAYCALFPKSYVINKEMLMHLWDAQGYIVPSFDGQSVESACEEHFGVLLQRCFFCDVNKDEFGDVESFKIHDLMHDLAQNVSGKEICIRNLNMPKIEDTARHVFEASEKVCMKDCVKSKLRSYLMFEEHYECGCDAECMNNLFKNWVCLRALALNFVDANASLPDTMGKMLHIRYLNLANNQFEKLPGSITHLQNLRTLDLRNCRKLKEWPKKFTKLTNLTHLYIGGCESLSCMPDGLHKLRNMRVLDEFLVVHKRESLRDLKGLAVKLKGKIGIKFYDYDFERDEAYEKELACLGGAKDLKKVEIIFSFPCLNRDNDEENTAGEEAVMETLQPHSNLLQFSLWHYNGRKIGSWGRALDNWATSLPNLVHIRLSNCKGLQQLPCLSKMTYLESLHLKGLEKLEFMEEDMDMTFCGRGDLGSPINTFFPSLESLEIRDCLELQGWWRSGDSSDMRHQPGYPRLSQVTIVGCPNLTSFPNCRSLQTVSLCGNNKALRIRAGDSSSGDDDNVGLIAELDCMDYLKLLTPQLLTGLYLSNDTDMESLWECEEMFMNCSSSLLTLEIQRYHKLSSLYGGLTHLTALHSLTLEGCKLLQLEDNNSLIWEPLCHNLRRLKLDSLNSVEILPSEMRFLISLEHFHIKECEKLSSLPNWISCLQSLQSLHVESCRKLSSLPEEMAALTSLQKLKLYKCPDLTEACQKGGNNWPKIKHIPRKDIW